MKVRVFWENEEESSVVIVRTPKDALNMSGSFELESGETKDMPFPSKVDILETTPLDIRMWAGMTQREFSEELDVGLSTVKSWEADPDSSYFRLPNRQTQKELKRFVDKLLES